MALLLDHDDAEDGKKREGASEAGPPPVAHAGAAERVPRVSIAASRIANSAHHGTALDSGHIAATLRRCVDDARGDLSLDAFAARSLYVSHETCTRTCAVHEVTALRTVFGDAAPYVHGSLPPPSMLTFRVAFEAPLSIAGAKQLTRRS